MTGVGTGQRGAEPVVAVLGLGAMGLPMATCLAASSAREAATGADVVLVSVRDAA